MRGLLYLLSCAPALSLLLLLPGCISADVAGQEDATPTSQTTSKMNLTDTASSPTDSTSAYQVSSRPVPQLPVTKTPSAATTKTSPTTTPSTGATTTGATISIFFGRQCAQLLLVNGVLILVCFILLISTFLLACRACRLNRRLKALSSNSDLISNGEYWMGTAKKNKSKSEIEAKETTVLMADLSQTQDEVNNGAAKEDGEKANKDGQKAEEKEAADDTPSGEASAVPVTSEEKSPSAKPQEGEADSAAAPSSEGTEQAKDVPKS